MSLYPIAARAQSSALLAVLRGIGSAAAYVVRFHDRPPPLIYGTHGPAVPPPIVAKAPEVAATPSPAAVAKASRAKAAATGKPQAVPVPPMSPQDLAARADAISALCNLGHKQAAAVALVNTAIGKLAPPLDVASLIKAAMAKPKPEPSAKAPEPPERPPDTPAPA